MATVAGLTYLHPALPNALLLPSPLQPGVEISIQGKVSSRSRRFSFNLQKGIGKKVADVVFHFNPRFEGEPVVVRNARTQGSWGEEERAIETEFPFAHKAHFRVVIQAHEECYKVLVNDNHFIDFNHRFPVDHATHLCIKGDVQIYAVHLPSPLNLPLLSTIPGNLKVGDIVVVNGQFKDGGSKFKVNLQTDAEETPDIILHVNPRLADGCIVRNTRTEQTWGPEENDGGMPLEAGAPFSLLIAVVQDRIQLFVNNSRLCDYSHRLPIENASRVQIDGDIDLQSVVIESPAQRVYPATGADRVIKPEHVISQEYNPVVPSSVKIQDGFIPGRLVVVSGIVHANASKFAVNIQSEEGDGGNIVLHFNPRFDDGSQVVRNSRDGDVWGAEEREGEFPFVRGAPFDLVLQSEDDVIRAFVGGNHLCDFVHRLYPSSGEYVRIKGDVFVKRVIIA